MNGPIFIKFRGKFLELCILNGRLVDALPTQLRSTHYGDGFFETFRYANGRIALLDQHLARAIKTAQSLNIPFDKERVLASISLLPKQQAGRGKLMVVPSASAGGYGGRGAESDYIIFFTPIQKRVISPINLGVSNVSLTPCQFGGLKHLNRLEQVMASLQMGEYDDLLMLDQEQQVIETTKANIFYRIGSDWFTPLVTNAGVAGVMRARIMSSLLSVNTELPNIDRLLSADEMFITNAFQGIVPVNKVLNQRFIVGKQTLHLISALHAEGFDAYYQ